MVDLGAICLLFALVIVAQAVALHREAWAGVRAWEKRLGACKADWRRTFRISERSIEIFYMRKGETTWTGKRETGPPMEITLGEGHVAHVSWGTNATD